MSFTNHVFAGIIHSSESTFPELSKDGSIDAIRVCTIEIKIAQYSLHGNFSVISVITLALLMVTHFYHQELIL